MEAGLDSLCSCQLCADENIVTWRGCLLWEFLLFHLLDEHLYTSWWHWYGGSFCSFYRFFHFSSLLKALISHVFFCAQSLFCGPPLWLASCDLLPCCPWLFNRCTVLRPVFGFFTFFFYPSSIFTSLFFAMRADFLLPDPSPPARQPDFALSNRSTVPGRDF